MALHVLCVASLSMAASMLTTKFGGKISRAKYSRTTSLQLASSDKESTMTYKSIFNFSNVEEDAVSKFERIDDAIM